MQSINQQNKQFVWDFLQDFGRMTAQTFSVTMQKYCVDDLEFDCAHPINSVYGLQDNCEQVLAPFFESFSNVAVRPYVYFGGKSIGTDTGRFENTDWVTTTGYAEAVFEKDYLHIPANGKMVFIRFFGMFQVTDGKITYIRLLPDFLDLMRQVGINYVTADANEYHTPAPYTMDGILMGEYDPAEGKKSVDTLLAWSYAPPEDRFVYQSEDFHWYGPAGIGTCIGMDDYCKHHRNPWLSAFPNRSTLGNQEYMYLGEANYSCVGTWCKAIENPPEKDLYMTHTGTYLGIPATGKALGIRDYDWYRTDETGRICDNWCMVDMIHMFYQMGVDIFKKLEEKDYTPIA